MNYPSNPQHCQCNTSKFCYEPHGHVITGDLMVIENVKLRELVAKGPKYREPNKINWQSTETMVSNSIDLYVEQWSKWEQVDLKYLSEWNKPNQGISCGTYLKFEREDSITKTENS